MKKEIVIQMTDSMESTPIARLVQLANRFESKVYFEMDTKKVNAKSIMGMMSLALTSGSTVTINAEGDDEQNAVDALEEFLSS